MLAETGTNTQAELIEQVCLYLTENACENITLDELGEKFAVSPFHLQRTFKHVTGITPREFADACRMGRFKKHLKAGTSITEALYDVGYSSSSRLYERTNNHLGMTPSAYRKGGKGMTIVYQITRCPLGTMLVAATERGVCAVKIGDDVDKLRESLIKEFPKADIQPDNETIGEWVQQILDYLSGWQPHLDLPLDIRSTAFQRRVWQELLRIPYGETRTYREIAEAIGSPKAARAVGNACGANPTPLIIPCHRVVKSDGHIGGYALGPERKEKLLDMEKGEEAEA